MATSPPRPASTARPNPFEERPAAVFSIVTATSLLLVLNPIVLSAVFHLDTIEGWLYVAAIDLVLVLFGLFLPIVSVTQGKPKILTASLAVLALLPGLVVAAEGAVGYRRYHRILAEHQDLPEQRSPLFAAHPALGWWHPPNTRAYASFPEGRVEIRAELDGWGRRKIDETPVKPKLHFFGDSYIFGFGVPDSQTALQLLARDPRISGRFEVLNYGVIGYGLEQMLMRLQLAQGEISKDDVVVFTFIGHDLVRSAKGGLWVCREPWHGADVKTFPVYQDGHLRVAQIRELCNSTVDMILFSGLPVGELLKTAYEWWYRDWRQLEMNADAIIAHGGKIATARGARFIAIMFPERWECRARQHRVNVNNIRTRVFTILERCPASREDVDRIFFSGNNRHWNARGNIMAADAILSVLEENGIR